MAQPAIYTEPETEAVNEAAEFFALLSRARAERIAREEDLEEVKE